MINAQADSRFLWEGFNHQLVCVNQAKNCQMNIAKYNNKQNTSYFKTGKIVQQKYKTKNKYIALKKNHIISNTTTYLHITKFILP